MPQVPQTDGNGIDHFAKLNVSDFTRGQGGPLGGRMVGLLVNVFLSPDLTPNGFEQKILTIVA